MGMNKELKKSLSENKRIENEEARSIFYQAKRNRLIELKNMILEFTDTYREVLKEEYSQSDYDKYLIKFNKLNNN